jgi:hypothetical protein
MPITFDSEISMALLEGKLFGSKSEHGALNKGSEVVTVHPQMILIGFWLRSISTFIENGIEALKMI